MTAVLLSGSLAGPSDAAERLQARRSDPRQRSLPYESVTAAARALPRPPPRHVDRIVYSFDAPARAGLVLSRELSDACRRGEFLQEIDWKYRAFGPREQPLGVAYGTGPINLVDPKRRREAGAVYFFANQDAGRCVVYVGQIDKLRPFFIGP